MTPEQSRTLKPGDRVGFDGYPDDIGTVQTTNLMYLRINWDDGHRSLTAHSDMKRVARVGLA
jgi:hypothetical protein